MYDVVKNDPKYMQRNYKPTVSNFQGMMKDQNNEYTPFAKMDD